MARGQAWLEKRRGGYVIRFNDPKIRKANGRPRIGLFTPRDLAGERVRTISGAQAELDAFLARLPAPPTKRGGTVIVPDRQTIQQIAWAWHQAHPSNTSRRSYLSSVQWLLNEKQLGITYPHELSAKSVAKFKVERLALPRGQGRSCQKPLAYLKAILNWAAMTAELIDPLDARLQKAMAQPQSKRARYELMTYEEWLATMHACRRWGPAHHALGHCLSLYGWRPSMACRIQVGDVRLAQRWISIRHVKDVSAAKDHEPVEHSIHPETIDLLRPLVEGRPSDAPLFTHGDAPWCALDRDDPTYGDGAPKFADWFRRVCGPLLGRGKGNANAWKRYAIHRMTNGEAPWPRGLNDEEIRRHTGHDDANVIRIYRRSNRGNLLALTAGPSPIDDEPVVLADEPVVWSGVDARHGVTEPDESVSFLPKIIHERT